LVEGGGNENKKLRWFKTKIFIQKKSLLNPMSKPKYDFGLNVLENLIECGLHEKRCDRLDLMAYNVNLNYLLKIFDKYGNLKKINIYSNSEKITYTKKIFKRLKKLINNNIISFYHIPEGENIIHAKMYKFMKKGDIILTGVGSPNFTKRSNQNLEVMYYIEEEKGIDFFEDFKISSDIFDYEVRDYTPKKLDKIEKEEFNIPEDLLEGLWEHQEEILKWLIGRNSAIVNIPPGTGKTKISLKFGGYLRRIKNATTIVLVPQTPLIDQWMKRLENENITCYEWGTSLIEDMEYFIAQPENKAVVTLYPRFFDQYKELIDNLTITSPSLYLISDECQKWFKKLDTLSNLNFLMNKYPRDFHHVGLSATLQTFNRDAMKRYIDLMGGEESRYRISLQSYYSKWNNLNDNPTLKPIKYYPIKYNLSDDEMRKYNKKSQNVAIEMGRENIKGNDFSAAMARARWVRNLNGGLNKLKYFISSHIETFNKNNTLIFVQTNDFAERIRDYITKHNGWDKRSSAYVYDSSRKDSYKKYAMKQYRNNQGFCLISEIMLREGFDLPKISIVVLHGSHKSPRDWIQKIGRAIRYDSSNPDSFAEIIDVVFCNQNGEPLSIEEERYKVLNSISVN